MTSRGAICFDAAGGRPPSDDTAGIPIQKGFRRARSAPAGRGARDRRALPGETSCLTPHRPASPFIVLGLVALGTAVLVLIAELLLRHWWSISEINAVVGARGGAGQTLPCRSMEPPPSTVFRD